MDNNGRRCNIHYTWLITLYGVMHGHHILRSLYIVSPTTQLSSVEFEFPVLQRPCFESKFLERSTVTFHGLQITLNFNCSSFDGSTIMCFLTGKRCHKTINHRSFYCFTDYSVYCFSNLSSTAVLMISSFALRGPLLIFLATENDRTDSICP